MQAFRVQAALAVVLGLTLTACGGSNNPTSPGGTGSGSHYFRAVIDGTSWTSSSILVNLGAAHSQTGTYVLTGGGTTGYSIVIALFNLAGPGTYPLGVGLSVAGGTVTVSDAGGAGWSTPLSGVAGTITITDLSDTHIAGTFSFQATPISGGATGTRSVTEGAFDLTVNTTGNPGQVPDNAASVVNAQIGGSFFNAANVVTNYNATTQTLSFVANNTGRSVTFTLLGVAGPGTYALTTGAGGRFITMTGDGSSPNVCCWASNNTGGSGSVVVASMTATRIRGTFTATLTPTPGASAQGNVAVAAGNFDVGYVTF